jgi:hypothetical protein
MRRDEDPFACQEIVAPVWPIQQRNGLRTLSGTRDEQGPFPPRARLVGNTDFLDDGVLRGGLDQGHGAAPKSASRHPTAENTTLPTDPARDIHGGVELVAAHLIVVAQGCVALVHEPSQLIPITPTHAFGGPQRPVNLTDDVPCAARTHLIQRDGNGVQFLQTGLTQRGQTERLRCSLTRSAPLRVSTAGELVFDVRVDDEHGDRRIGQRQPGRLQGTTVQQ